MANRFWVTGGNGTWTSTTNWSATSGGARGASVPTAADSVFFDRAATYTVSIATGSVCLNITVSAGTVTFGSSATLTISGSMSLIAGTLWTNTSPIVFASTATGRTITTNGVTFAANITFSGVGGAWTLGSALTTTGLITISSGTFNTGNFSLTASQLSSTVTTTRAINLGSSTVTLSNATPINISSTTGLTFTHGTSLINCTSTATLTFTSPGLTFYDVSFTGVPTIFNSTRTISGANTFRNLTFTPYTNGALGALPVVFNANQTITGTWSASGASEIRRIWYRSSVLGTAITITLTSPQTISNADFRDITAVTSAITATGGGNCGGNTNITGFPAAKTVYWNLTGSQDWSATGWATTSGGSPAAANFPLAQDTAIFNNTGAASTVTTNGSWNMGTVDMSARTSAMNFTVSGSQNIHGSWSFGTGVTVTSGSGSYSFSGRGNTQTISCAGKSFGAGANVFIQNLGGTVQLADAFTTASGSSGFLSLQTGTLNLVSYTATCGRLFVDSTGPGSRTIAFGTGNITATQVGGTPVILSSSNFTRTGTPTINVSNAGSTACTITLGTGWTASNACSFNITAGTYALTFLNVANNGVLDVNFTGFTGTLGATSSALIYGNLTLSAGMTLTASATALTIAGDSSAVKDITTNNKTIDFPLTFSNSGSWRLQGALTLAATRTVTLTSGILNLNDFILSTGFFSSNNTSVRTINFGNTGSITLTGATIGTKWDTGTVTNLSITGEAFVQSTGAGAVTKTFNTGSLSEANSISFSIADTAGTITFTANNTVKNLTIGNNSITISNIALIIYGSLSLAGTNPTLTAGSNIWTFASTSGIKYIATNGETLDFPITFNGVNGTWELLTALTMGSTRALTHTNGTINLSGKTLTVGTTYTTASGTKNLTFNGGTLICAATFNNAAPTGFTTTAGTGTGTISMTSAAQKNFFGGGSTYNCTLNLTGAGNVYIYGNNTFNNITNTPTMVTVRFDAGSTNTFNDFNLLGTLSNPLTVGAVPESSQHTLSKASGTVSSDYLNIIYSAATGGATWYAGANSINSGNNTGWIFTAPPVFAPGVFLGNGLTIGAGITYSA